MSTRPKYVGLVVQDDHLVDAPRGSNSLPVIPGDHCIFEERRDANPGDVICASVKEGSRPIVGWLRQKDGQNYILGGANQASQPRDVWVPRRDVTFLGVLVAKYYPALARQGV